MCEESACSLRELLHHASGLIDIYEARTDCCSIAAQLGAGPGAAAVRAFRSGNEVKRLSSGGIDSPGRGAVDAGPRGPSPLTSRIQCEALRSVD